MSLHFMNLTILPFRIDVIILYIVGKHLIIGSFFEFVVSFVFSCRYVTPSVRQ